MKGQIQKCKKIVSISSHFKPKEGLSLCSWK